MSRYTTEYRFILENEEWTDERLGLADFPIFDESYRSGLVAKIKSHFMFDEIGSETPARHAQRVKNKLFNIMPYYNQLYESCLIQINPMLTMDYNVKLDSRLTEILNAIRNSTNDKTGNGTVDTVSHEDSSVNKVGTTENDNESNSVVVESDDLSNGDTGITTKHHAEIGVDGERDGYNKTTTTEDFNVVSDTPEGFVATKAIGNSTYANTASKDENTVDTSGYDTVNKNYNHDNYDYDTKDNTGVSNSIKNNLTNSNDTGSGEYGEINTNVKDGTVNVTSQDIIQDIVNAIEESVKNAETDALTHYAGYNNKTMSQMLQEWRETFLNIDMMILEELEPLFIGVLN